MPWPSAVGGTGLHQRQRQWLHVLAYAPDGAALQALQAPQAPTCWVGNDERVWEDLPITK